MNQNELAVSNVMSAERMAERPRIIAKESAVRKPVENATSRPSLHHMPEPAVAVAEVRAAEAFGEWLDRELVQLVARWEHMIIERPSRWNDSLRG